MAITNAICYKGFVLDCAPVELDVDSFAARCIISRESGDGLDEHAFTDLCSSTSAPLAVSFAKTWGRHWVDEHGKESDTWAGLRVH